MSPIKQDSPLDFLRNKSPRNPVRAIKRLEADMQSRMNNDVEADSVEQLAPDLGNAGLGGTGQRADGYYNVIRLGNVTHGDVDYVYSEIPPFGILEDNIVEIEVHAQVFNNTGSGVLLSSGIHIGASYGTLIRVGILVPTSSVYQRITSTFRLQQAAQRGDNVATNVKVEVQSPSSSGTPRVAEVFSIFDLSGEDFTDEMPLRYSIVDFASGFTGQYSVIWDTMTVRVLDGASGETQYFWTQPWSTDSHDTVIIDSSPTTNFGSNAEISFGEFNGGAQVCRSLIRFDQIANLPENAIIESAKLHVCLSTDQSSNARTAEVYRVVRNWTASGATWNTYDGSNNWSTAGCGHSTNDYDGSVVWASTAFTATEALGTWKTFDLDVDEFTKWINGTNPNYGLLIKMQTESNDKWAAHSGNTATAAAAPVLSVKYSLPLS